MRKLIVFIVLIITFSCSTETKEYTIREGGNSMTLKLKSDFKFRKIGSLWRENDSNEYFGVWRYIDQQNGIIETTTYGTLGGSIWTATPKDTFRIQGDQLLTH